MKDSQILPQSLPVRENSIAEPLPMVYGQFSKIKSKWTFFYLLDAIDPIGYMKFVEIKNFAMRLVEHDVILISWNIEPKNSAKVNSERILEIFELVAPTAFILIH